MSGLNVLRVWSSSTVLRRAACSGLRFAETGRAFGGLKSFQSPFSRQLSRFGASCALNHGIAPAHGRGTREGLNYSGCARSCTSKPTPDDESRMGYAAAEHLDVKPLPEGIDDSRIGLYELVGTDGTGPDGKGLRTILGVHGPPEYWAGYGGNFETASGGSFAIVKVGGHDYKVTAGDTLWINRIPGDVNCKVQLDKVLLVGTVKWSMIGRPEIPGATVTATVESQTKTAKVMVTKFKKRKGYRRTKGHRQPITRLSIDSINYELPTAEHIVPHEVEYDPLRPDLPNSRNFL